VVFDAGRVEILKSEMDFFLILPYPTMSRTSIDFSGFPLSGKSQVSFSRSGKVMEFLNWSGKKDFLGKVSFILYYCCHY